MCVSNVKHKLKHNKHNNYLFFHFYRGLLKCDLKAIEEVIFFFV